MAGETQIHRTSLAVWDVPATVVAGERFTVRAGAKSSAESNLQGRRIEARDASGCVIASAALGSARWPETNALYWTELSLPAPEQHGIASLSVRFEAAGLTSPHRDASTQFSVMVVAPPEHMVTIQVVEQETSAPIGDAEIRLGACRAITAASGQARLHLAKGQYNLHIWKVGYDAPQRSVTVDGDVVVAVAATIVPEENADRAWRA